jgi:hypothetical protein
LQINLARNRPTVAAQQSDVNYLSDAGLATRMQLLQAFCRRALFALGSGPSKGARQALQQRSRRSTAGISCHFRTSTDHFVPNSCSRPAYTRRADKVAVSKEYRREFNHLPAAAC